MVNTKYRTYNSADDNHRPKTAVVLGLGRSGTSFVASVLDYLGCFMGEKAGAGTLEDPLLSEAMESNNDGKFQEIVSQRNTQHDIWGFKRPSSLLHINRIAPYFRNPYYIFIHRDFFAIALRNEVSIGRDVGDSLGRCIQHAPIMYELMAKTSRPSLHMSYELCLTAPLLAAEVVRDFVFPENSGESLDEADFNAAMNKRHKVYLGGSKEAQEPFKGGA